MRNATLTQVRDFIRQPYAWPGGYPMALFMTDGACLCAKCARNEYRAISWATRHNDRTGWAAMGVDVLWEGPAEHCAHCNAEMQTAYGDPDAEGGE